MNPKRKISLLSMLLTSTIFAGTVSAVAEDLFDLSLEQLMNVDVTSVAKKKQKVSESAAAIYVVTADDIRRSGAQNLPEILRMVPGVSVSRINGSQYSVSVRGFD